MLNEEHQLQRIVTIFIRLASVDYSQQAGIDYRVLEELAGYLYMVIGLSEDMKVWVHYAREVEARGEPGVKTRARRKQTEASIKQISLWPVVSGIVETLTKGRVRILDQDKLLSLVFVKIVQMCAKNIRKIPSGLKD